MACAGNPRRALIGVALLAWGGLAAASLAPRLDALVWTDPAAARAVLLSEPATCLRDGDEKRIALGRALFNTPQLLGGQAARAGISCASCHANGRRSAHFQLDGVSGAPGTADVSSAFFSIARANRQFDPKPIPDLAGEGKVARDPSSGALEPFLRGLIVEEFAGRDPPAEEVAALAAYVRVIASCENRAEEPRRMAQALDLAQDMVTLAAQSSERGTMDTAALLITGARYQLGLVHERLAEPGLGAERALLVTASRRLQPLGRATPLTPQRLRAWKEKFRRTLRSRLLRAEPRSLYSPKAVDAWLAG